MSIALANIPVDTLTVSMEDQNPRATRYGLVPIWPYVTNSRSFYVWEIPANVIFPFRPFICEILQDLYGNELARYERLPKDQINDLLLTCKEFIYLEELSQYGATQGTEEDIYQIISVLSNPNRCKKYGLELNNSCVQCWLEYLDKQFDDVVENYSFDKPESMRVAKVTANKLKLGFMEALNSARRRIDVAIRDLEDKKSGKETFTDFDMLAIYHTHSERPKYKTTVGSDQSVLGELAEAMTALKEMSGQNAEINKALIKKILEFTKKETQNKESNNSAK